MVEVVTVKYYQVVYASHYSLLFGPANDGFGGVEVTQSSGGNDLEPQKDAHSVKGAPAFCQNHETWRYRKVT
ncbi:hypothetical protein VNO77_05741 [Canavalia gladiata]|uniref:Uncharacterized protein n=1 Tax=Canavalia gladiata TaxID=3824 RepID=A0AAN9N5H0_CANGL